ncbi:Short-chain dehydrogenase/reductase SDR [Sulfitobacter noctilucicola]|uniref:3-oxoacyl-[acyl-carrier protein] reductase n=1 Tax=Sulfitobacter noctilucicola TaxID=1342301 RepID=A0A7W6Q6M2_9RHOB|nr:SDR family oxidoreductase [Sulfitobacter noctilucicola]KIN63551.1 Short-chain dehydrogenase/reductase SDR [Sulfitobacter noctilucicola]MBB4174940.1 3-oxoacyl-[acyl-carrier protein] reductase [Sulfitobacter noctilucicola]
MRNVIVTGAGSGIGFAVAEKLAGLGYNVVLNDYDADAAQAAAAKIGGLAVQGDVSDEADVARMVEACTAEFGAPTHLVNNAGHVHQARFTDLSVADFDRMISVHLRGTFLCTRAVLPAMIASGSGCVVNMASQLGQIGGIELVHYSAAKAGIIGMTKALAREVSTQGVRVNAVAPGPINTPLVRALSDDWRAAKAAELPLGHFGEPEDVAETVAFLCSDAARIYVGQTLSPNSGDVML